MRDVRLRPFRGSTGQAQRATEIRQRSGCFSTTSEAGQVTSAGRQTPSEGPAQCGGDPPRDPAEHSLCRRLAATEGWRDFRRARVLTVTNSKTLLGGRGAVRGQGKLAEAFVPAPTREGERFSGDQGAFHHKLSARSVGIAPQELRTDLSVTLPVGIASGSASAFGTACRVSWP